MPDDDGLPTRFWWTCAFGCGQGGGEAAARDRDESKATHEQFCPRNPAPPSPPKR